MAVEYQCVKCGSKENLIKGPNFSRITICQKCFDKEQAAFTEDMTEALHGRKKD